jgi:hypothetical protein
MFVAKLFAVALAGFNLLVAGRTIPSSFQHLEQRVGEYMRRFIHVLTALFPLYQQNTQYQGYGFVYFTGEDLPNGTLDYAVPIQNLLDFEDCFIRRTNIFRSVSLKYWMSYSTCDH